MTRRCFVGCGVWNGTQAVPYKNYVVWNGTQAVPCEIYGIGRVSVLSGKKMPVMPFCSVKKASFSRER